MPEILKRFIILDGNAITHRAYHALPALTTKKGELVNAVYGFLLVLFKTIKEFQPDFIAACFDLPAPTFRHEKYKEYKAKRPPAPPELYAQLPKIKKVLKSFNIAVFEKEGYEADDLIGTLAQLVQRKQIFPRVESIIVSGDSDTFQLVNPSTKVYFLRKGVKDTVLYDEQLVREKYDGLLPGQLPDFKALKGDPSDNVPGIKGVGEKGALSLIQSFGSLERLYESLKQKDVLATAIKPKLKDLILQQKEQAIFSKDLVHIKIDVPLELQLESCRWGQYEKGQAAQSLKDLEFYSLLSKIPEANQTLF